MRRSRPLMLLTVVALLASLGAPPAPVAAAGPVSFTILHTNDFHGNLELSGSNPGAARVAQKISDVRTVVGAAKVLVFDAGDIMQGSLLSNLQKGLPTIDYYRTIGYNAATFGNHEFDWGQTVLGERIAQAEAPATADESPMKMITANITKKDAGDVCNSEPSNWEPFNANVTPYEVFTVGTAPDTVRVGVIGVGSVETPYITIAEATAGLCFRDPAKSILHYYDALDAASDVIVVLSHNGYVDGGYGYGFTVYGDQTLAAKLNTAGKPVNLIIGGHSHTDVTTPAKVGNTTVVQAHYAGRKVGRADFTVDTGTGAVTVAWSRIVVATTDPEYPPIKDLVASYASNTAYQALINKPIGYSQVDLSKNYNTDNMMGDFVDDAIYGALNTDTDPANNVDMFFNNAGGIRTDWCDKEDPAGSGTYVWTSTAAECQTSGLWSHAPMLLTYGNMFQILPFGNATAVGTMTGAQIYELLNQSATLFKGAIQPSGIRFKFYRYSDALPGPQPYAWGAYDVEVYDKSTSTWKALEPAKIYKVGTNEFLAPAGQDGYMPFKYMKNITYWGDMLNAVNDYVGATYGTPATAYMGPNGDGMLDGRITRDGGDAAGSGSIVPITILHNNDSHGNLAKTGYVGYTQLATLIKQERAHNPSRTILVNGGDQIQGDAMMYYFKSSYTGFASDGTPLPAALKTNPMMAVMNALGYDAMTLGNHEFNFGGGVFKGVMGQANFAVLGANVSDTGAYGLSAAQDGAGVQPYFEKTLDGIKVGILGITNHRVPNYELPSNIAGLTFSNPLTAAQTYATELRARDDVVIGLTHIGFTENPLSVEVDANVDTNMAAQVSGLDAIIGSHSHTDPSKQTAYSGAYKLLPTIVGGPGNTPVLVTQAYRYNSYLGEVVLGVRAKAGGGYEVVSRAGQYLAVAYGTPTSPGTPEEPAIKAIIDPYVAALTTYTTKVIGQTTVPIDTMAAFTSETNGANLQADAAVFELAKNGITDVDVHLSGAMTNRKVPADPKAGDPPIVYPVTLKVADMFSLMPYENSLVVLNMNGRQLKAVLERAYRNYYYYKYFANADPMYGGYSYYTTCMLDTNSIGRIYYNDTSPALPNGSNVKALIINGKPVDFADAAKFYKVSTVNYLAAGSCNFNDAGVSLWPLNQIADDTQYYVRDAVIDYITAKGTVSPAIEGRLLFGDIVAPVVTISVPLAPSYPHPSVTLDFSAVDGPDGTTPSFAPPSGVASITAGLDGTPVVNGQVIDLRPMALGSSHTLTVTAVDYYGNSATKSATFTVTATVVGLKASVNQFFTEGKIIKAAIRDSLLAQLTSVQASIAAGKNKTAINQLNAFINLVQAQSGKAITKAAADLLITDAKFVIATLK